MSQPEPLRTLTREFRVAFQLNERKRWLAWGADRQRRLFRKEVYADIKAGLPAPESCFAILLDYLLDTTYSDNREAIRFQQFLDQRNVPASKRHAPSLLDLISSVHTTTNPFLVGTDAIKNIFDLTPEPMRGVRPCKNDSEVRQLVRWKFIDAGRKGDPTVSEASAIQIAEAIISTPLEHYAERLVRWHRVNAWTVTVVDDDTGEPVAGSVIAPVSAERYQAIREGRIDMLRSELEPHVRTSPNLFVELVFKVPRSLPPAFADSPMIHVYRAHLCQQAVLTDVPGLGEEIPARFVSLGLGPEHMRWLKAFSFDDLGVVSPEVKIPLWERIAWSSAQGLRESPHWGTWRMIQRHFRAQPAAIVQSNPRPS